MIKSIKKSALITSVCATVLLSVGGCAGTGMSNSESSAVVGTIVGGAIGNRFGGGSGRKVTTVLGAALGGYLGSNLGRNIDQNDQNYITTALSETPDNRPVRWNNNNTGSSYAFTPTNSYQATVNNRPAQCRSYTMLVDMQGSPQRVNGKACNVNGQWVNAQ